MIFEGGVGRVMM